MMYQTIIALATMSNNVAKAEARDKKRFREYQQNRRQNDGWDCGTKRASFDTDPTNMSNDQIVLQHEELLKMQKQEHTAGHSHTAKDIARRRNELWQEAKQREIEKQLL